MILVCGLYGMVVVPQILDTFGKRLSKIQLTKKSINDYILQHET